jgi:HSP20 family protein
MKLTRRQRGDQGALAPFARGALAPLNELNRLRREIDRLFQDPFSLLNPTSSFFEGETPKVDVYEDQDRITVQAELPGMKKEDIDVSMHGGVLTISGERKEEQERREGETFRSERYFGRFQRAVTLPQPVDPNRIEARYKDGILTVVCQKTEEAKRKRIEVKTS